MSAAEQSFPSEGLRIMPTYESEGWLLLGDEDNKEVLSFNSLIELSIESGGTVPTQKIEQGSFAAYNKTEEPLKIAASIAFEGTVDELQDALASINELKADTKKFSLITPEFEYTSLTLESFSYARKREEGRGVLYVQLNLVEVREVETATTTVKLPKKKCKKADCASQKNNGAGQSESDEATDGEVFIGQGNKSMQAAYDRDNAEAKRRLMGAVKREKGNS